jgi:3-ketosteroid 9alpha-hydroxylase-like protein
MEDTAMDPSEREFGATGISLSPYRFPVWHDRHARSPYWQPPVLAELETQEYYPLHPHSRMLNRVKVHAQMIIENAADPYHVQYVHKAANPVTTASFELSGITCTPRSTRISVAGGHKRG